MSKYGYLKVFQSPVELEITRVDCTYQRDLNMIDLAILCMHSVYQINEVKHSNIYLALCRILTTYSYSVNEIYISVY